MRTDVEASSFGDFFDLFEEEKARATRLFAKHVVPLLAAGSVRPVVDSVYKLEQVREAHLRLESNESFGKVVLEIQ